MKGFIEFTELIPKEFKEYGRETTNLLRKPLQIRVDTIVAFKENFVYTKTNSWWIAETYEEIKQKIKQAKEQK